MLGQFEASLCWASYLGWPGRRQLVVCGCDSLKFKDYQSFKFASKFETQWAMGEVNSKNEGFVKTILLWVACRSFDQRSPLITAIFCFYCLGSYYFELSKDSVLA